MIFIQIFYTTLNTQSKNGIPISGKKPDHIEDQYQIRFKSKESYYQLFKEAGTSWKKTQKKNPKRDEELVQSKHKEICKILEYNREAMEAGKVVVYLIDECHLLWGDACGYIWGCNLGIHLRLK